MSINGEVFLDLLIYIDDKVECKNMNIVHIHLTVGLNRVDCTNQSRSQASWRQMILRAVRSVQMVLYQG